ncbi:hypothetical protein CPB86DRAFT_778972 [Serendipita vermifera]|nr:hypothetical protein CPB86DRAFT_778972 [Serendipita vermifera]
MEMEIKKNQRLRKLHEDQKSKGRRVPRPRGRPKTFRIPPGADLRPRCFPGDCTKILVEDPESFFTTNGPIPPSILDVYLEHLIATRKKSGDYRVSVRSCSTLAWVLEAAKKLRGKKRKELEPISKVEEGAQSTKVSKDRDLEASIARRIQDNLRLTTEARSRFILVPFIDDMTDPPHISLLVFERANGNRMTMTVKCSMDWARPTRKPGTKYPINVVTEKILEVYEQDDLIWNPPTLYRCQVNNWASGYYTILFTESYVNKCVWEIGSMNDADASKCKERVFQWILTLPIYQDYTRVLRERKTTSNAAPLVGRKVPGLQDHDVLGRPRRNCCGLARPFLLSNKRPIRCESYCEDDIPTWYGSICPSV